MKLQLNKRLLGPNGKFDIDVEVSIEEKKLITLYGESGAGKTSILKMIAGLLEPDNGYIEIDDQRWYSSEEKINLKPQLRNVGFVFQEYALFPNMTVLQNLEYALDAKQNKMIISELIDMIELGDLRHRKPETLSGGQKQRVALARALVRKPRLLLLDEPLSALDQTMRIKLQDYILRVHRKFELTTLLVSHEVGEVVKMSDEILVLNEGKIIQRETPLELFSKKGVSGKFKFTGDIIAIERQEVVFVISVLIGNNLVKVVADEREAVHLQVGDEVMVASKAFNPIIQKINQPS